MNAIRPGHLLKGASRTVRLGAVAVVALVLAVSVVPAEAGQSPTGSASATPKPLLRDLFNRDVASGWGTPTIGGTYRARAVRASSVRRGHGVVFLRPGVTAVQVPGKVVVRDALIGTSMRLSKIPTAGAGATTSLNLRSRGARSYKARMRVATDGRVTLGIYRVDTAGATKKIGPTRLVMTGLSTTDTLHFQFMAAGSASVRLAARVWTGPRKPDWQLIETDATSSRLRGPGSPAVRVALSAGSEALKVLFDKLEIWSVDAGDDSSVPPSVPPTTTTTTTTDTGSGIDVGPSSTGVPAGSRLVVHEGDLTVTTPGAVIDGLDIRGFVTIAAPNVTIKNSIVRGRAAPKPLINNLSGQPGLKVIDTELFPTSPSPDANGIFGYNFTLTRVDVHGVIDAVHITGGNVIIEDSWLHDNLHYLSDPNFNGAGSHDDSIQIQVGSNILVTGSRISGAYNAGVQITQDRGPVSNVTIADNFMDGGGCTINIAEKSFGPLQGIAVTDNVFGRNARLSDCAIIARPSTVMTVTRNRYHPDGTIVTVRRG